MLEGWSPFILASILIFTAGLPALNKSKTKAQGIGCLSNLKQMGMAWNMYALDNNDKIPPNNGDDQSGFEMPKKSRAVSLGFKFALEANSRERRS